MKVSGPASFLMIIILLLFFPVNLCSQTNVTLFPTVKKDIGGYKEVQEVFGMMTGNIDSRSKPYLKVAKITGIRNIVNYLPTPANPPGIGFLYSPWSNKTPAFATIEESNTWFDGFLVMDPFPIYNSMLKWVSDYFDDKYGAVNVTLAGSIFIFDGRLERNLDGARNHLDAYLQGIKNSIPAGAQSRLKYFQLTNEPHSTDVWAGQFNGDQLLTVESYTRVYNALYDYLRVKHPDVTVIGTCIGHDGAYLLTDRSTHPGVNWDVWVKYFIDNVENPLALGYYNPNCYGIPTVRNLAYVSMTQNYGDNARGVRPRYIITETSAPLSGGPEKNYRNQLLHISHDIFMMLDNPDKYAARYAFFAADGMENYSIFISTAEGVVPQSPYWVLSALRNLRGTNIYLEKSNNDIFAFASSPDPEMIVAAFFNSTTQNKRIKLNTGIPEYLIDSITRRKAVWNPLKANADYSETSLSDVSSQEIIMEPLSVYAIEMKLNKAITWEDTVRTREFYGSEVKKDLTTVINLNIPVPELPGADEKVFLRIGVDKRVSTGFLPVKLNGFNYNYDLAQQPPSIIETWHDMVGFIEILVNKDHLSLNNALIVGPFAGRTLLFSSIRFVEKTNISTNVENAKQTSPFKIYPNPVSDKLIIEGDPGMPFSSIITISSIDGKVHLVKNMEMDDNVGLMEFNVGNLPVGIYICRVVSSGRRDVFRFVKK